jgi:ABC-type multidrug transport system ATPase subunit
MPKHTHYKASTAAVLQATGLSGGPGAKPVFAGLDIQIPAGLTAVTGDEGTGKTSLLRLLAGDLPLQAGTRPAVDALWLNLALPEHDETTPEQVWAELQKQCPQWNAALQDDLTQALSLQVHLGKKLFMLSTGSRRKVGLVALLACGATLTCLDQPYMSLDRVSIQVVRDFLNDMADHPTRAWLVADYEADPDVDWRSEINLNTYML